MFSHLIDARHHLYQDGLSSHGGRVCQGAVLIMRDFEGGLLKESRGGLDSFAGEKGEIVLRSGLGCGKEDLLGVIALSSRAGLWP